MLSTGPSILLLPPSRTSFLSYMLLICLLFLLEIANSHDFNVRESYHASIVQRSPLLFDELDQYVKLHNNDTVLKDSNFCNRRFTLATYACPQALGNHMHEFTNNIAGAFITNRTVLWHFCNRKACQLDNEGDCDQFVSRLPWILSFQQAQVKWNEMKCEGSFNPFQVVQMKFRFQAEEILVCCGLDALSHVPALDFGTLELHEFYSLALNYSVRLTSTSHRRARLLFEFGEDFGYGILFRLAFKIKSFITDKNSENINNLLAKSSATLDDAFIIGIHIRHSDPNSKDEGVDNSEYDCIGRAIASHYSNTTHKKCVILLASDRPHEFEKWEADKRFPGCTTLTSSHAHNHTAWSEHGPFTGEIAVSDIDLLSRSDIFIGSSYGNAQLRNIVSTFSMIAAELRATNGRSPISRGVKSIWLPYCHEVIGARHQHKDFMTNPEFKCGNSITRVGGQLNIPLQCPYWNKTELDLGSKNDLWFYK